MTAFSPLHFRICQCQIDLQIHTDCFSQIHLLSISAMVTFISPISSYQALLDVGQSLLSWTGSRLVGILSIGSIAKPSLGRIMNMSGVALGGLRHS